MCPHQLIYHAKIGIVQIFMDPSSPILAVTLGVRHALPTLVILHANSNQTTAHNTNNQNVTMQLKDIAT